MTLVVGDGTLICDDTDSELDRALGLGDVKPCAEKLTLWGMVVSTAGVKEFSMGCPGGYSLCLGTSTGGRTEREEILLVESIIRIWHLYTMV